MVTSPPRFVGAASSVYRPRPRCAMGLDGSTTLFEDNGMEQLNWRRHPKVEVRVESPWDTATADAGSRGLQRIGASLRRGQRPACGSPRRALSRMWVTCFSPCPPASCWHSTSTSSATPSSATRSASASTCSPTNATAPRPARIPAGTLEVADQFSGQGNGLLRSPPLRFPAPYADVHVPDGCRPCRSAQLAYPGRPAGPAVCSPATSAQLVTSRRTKLIPLTTSRTAANASDSISARE